MAFNHVALLCLLLVFCILSSSAARLDLLHLDGSVYTESWPSANSIICRTRNNWSIGVKNGSNIDWGGCGFFLNGSSIDISSYTSIAINAVLQNSMKNLSNNIQFRFELMDTNGVKAAIQIALTRKNATLYFPVANFNGIDLTKITGILATVYSVVPGQLGIISQVWLTDSKVYPVFNDNVKVATAPPSGPPLVTSWPDDKPCNPIFSDSSIEGKRVLMVPKGTWGCGISTIPINLGEAQKFLFSMRSTSEVLMEFADVHGTKVGIHIASTENKWKTFNYPTSVLTDQGLDLSNLVFQFMITKVGDVDAFLRLDNFRFFF